MLRKTLVPLALLVASFGAQAEWKKLTEMPFGTMSYEDAATSLRLFAREVMPAFRRHFSGARV